jgi:hypothetical protein
MAAGKPRRDPCTKSAEEPWWAIVASLVATARLNGVEPLAWLTDVLERMVSGRTKAHELERLLPWTWKVELLTAVVLHA